MRTVQSSLGGVEKAAGSSHASMGRLGQEMVTLTRRLLGLNPVVAQATNVLGGMAVGSTTMVGVLAGAAAVGYAFDKLTESSRKAMEAGDKLTETYNRAARISALGIGGQQKADLEEINKGVQEHAKWLGMIVSLRTQLGAMGGLLKGIEDTHVQGVTQGTEAAANARQQAVNALGMQMAKDNQAWADRIKRANEEAAAAMRKASEQAMRYRESLERLANLDLPGIMRNLLALTATPPDIQAIHQSLMDTITPPSFSMPNVGINDSLTEEQRKTREQMGILVDDTRKQTETIANAVLQSAGIIVNALNIGGGGRGSSIGGSLGSVLGTAVGTMAGTNMGSLFGSLIAPGVGTIIGGLAGSLLGGLFDHKKAVDNNTMALNRVASLLNAPTGFKGQYYTFQAEDSRRIYRQQVETARREGMRGGRAGFALQAGHF